MTILALMSMRQVSKESGIPLKADEIWPIGIIKG